MTIGFYAVVLLLAAGRQLAAWTNGWRVYGNKNTEVLILRRASSKTPGELQPHAVACSEHTDLYLPLSTKVIVDYGTAQRSAVAPAPSGTRHWTYKVVIDSAPISWPEWVARCFKLSAMRRFREPDIDMCPSC